MDNTAFLCTAGSDISPRHFCGFPPAASTAKHGTGAAPPRDAEELRTAQPGQRQDPLQHSSVSAVGQCPCSVYPYQEAEAALLSSFPLAELL